MSILRDQIEFVRSPRAFAGRLATDPRAAFIGFRNTLGIAVLYEVAILLWAFGAEGVTLPPFLRIPEEDYYFYELIFLIPLFLITWLLASAIGYVASKALGGTGSFDSILGGFGVTMAVSAYFTLLPDYLQGILWTTGLVSFQEYQELTGSGGLLLIVWAYMLAYVLAHLVLYSVTIHHTQGIGGFRSVCVALLSFVGSFSVWIMIAR